MSICKKGHIGIGKFNSIKNKTYYSIWTCMIHRCYDKKYSTYVNCSVDERFLNFQNFCEWCEIYWQEGFSLDKDILIKGNKIYSPETCCFVPKEINNIFTKSDSKRGQYPIGVSFNIEINNFQSQINISGKVKNLGYYSTPEIAFKVYKENKEQYIQDIAERDKYLIKQHVYQALINYKVEITD